MSKKNVEWEWKKLGDVGEIIGGSTPKTSVDEYWTGNNVWITPAEIGKNLLMTDSKRHISDQAVIDAGLKKMPKGTVILSSRAPIGKVAIAGVDFYCNQGFKNIVCGKNLFNKFLYYFLIASNAHLESLGKGTTFKEISKTVVEAVSIPIPPLDDQERIVKVLDDAFKKIDTIKTTAETNLQNAKELFQTTLANELSITDEKIKQGWEERTLENTCELMCGYAFDSKGYSIHSKDTLLICGDNIVNCDFRWDTEKRWPKEKCSELKRFELRLNDIVLAMDRPWVKSGLKIAKVSERELPSLLVQRTACLRAHQKLSQDFLYFCLQNAPFSSYLTGNQTGGGVPHISGKQILAYIIPLPPLPVQKQIVAKLDSLSEKVKQLESNYKQVLADCDELKKALLKQAFEGML